MDKVTLEIISALKEACDEQAHTNMQFPKSKKFEHGIQVGNYQGLQRALQIIENAIREDDDQP